MGQPVLQSQSTFTRLLGGWTLQPVAPIDAIAKEKPTDHPNSLVALLQNVATRSRSDGAGFDPERMAAALRDRVVGLELNLCDLDAEEERCLKEWLPEDWAAFQAYLASGGGRGIAYVELSAELVPDFVPGLQQLDALECVSVWSPVRGDSIDFGILNAGIEPLRINILGKPERPLKITAFKNVIVEGREGQHPPIAKSLVYRTDEWGVINPVPLPLATPQAASTAPPAMPCAGDPELVETLVRFLQSTARPPRVLSDLLDARGVAQALVRCGAFDDRGDFGFDLRGLTPQQARRVQALPSDAWSALQASAERSGEDIAWLKLHDAFTLTIELVRSLNQLSPLFTLSVATPRNVNVLDLTKLQGGAARLETLHLRCVAGRKWAVKVPELVTVLPILGERGGALKECKVTYEDSSGKVVREQLLSPKPEKSVENHHPDR